VGLEKQTDFACLMFCNSDIKLSINLFHFIVMICIVLLYDTQKRDKNVAGFTK